MKFEAPTIPPTLPPGPLVGIKPLLGLVVLWTRQLPTLVGSALLFDEGIEWLVGRGGTAKDDPARRVFPIRMRPGANQRIGPIGGERMSRRQLVVRSSEGSLHVRNIGRCPMVANQQEMDRVVLRPGDCIELRRCMVLLCVERHETVSELPPGILYPSYAFGEADPFGIVGESPAVWKLREHVAFVGARKDHVLLTGASGTGKELVASAIAKLGNRYPFVTRNAATIPTSLTDAELFGNKKDYPNPGMAERKGLVGEAHTGTLFLDEIGELGHEQQAHFLRVLDGGEYQRLGEDKRRTSQFRLIGATNRAPDELKHDFLARFSHRIFIPDLNDRAEDLPLLLRRLFDRIAERDPQIRGRFAGEHGPRIAPELITRLVVHRWTTHVRELETLLWESMMTSRGDTIDAIPKALTSETAAPVAGDGISAERVEAALLRHSWVVSKAWQELGLSSRYQLIRLMKRYGIERPD